MSNAAGVRQSGSGSRLWRRQQAWVSSLIGGLLLVSVSVNAAPPGCQAVDQEKLALVQRLYHDFPDTAEKAGLMAQRAAVWGRYFDAALVKALSRDQQCAMKEGECNLDMDPIYNSQDPATSHIDYHCAEGGVAVDIHNKGGMETVHARYVFSRQGRAWRISDIVYPPHASLKAMLSAH